MTKLCRHILVILLFRIDWRKLLLFSSLLTIVSLIVQISRLPYPLSELVFAPSTIPKSTYKNITSTYKNINRVTSENIHFAPVGQLATLQVNPINVSLDIPAKVNQSVPKVEEVVSSKNRQRNSRRRRRRRRRRRQEVEEIDEVTTPPSPPSYANTSKEVLVSFPPQ